MKGSSSKIKDDYWMEVKQFRKTDVTVFEKRDFTENNDTEIEANIFNKCIALCISTVRICGRSRNSHYNKYH